MRKIFRNKKGQGLVEYGILVGGIALVCLAATAILGHKTNDLIATVAAVLPGAHAHSNAPIVSGKLVATTGDGDDGEAGALRLDVSGSRSMADNLGLDQGGLEALIVEPGHDHGHDHDQDYDV